MAWKTRVLDWAQRLFSSGTFNSHLALWASVAPSVNQGRHTWASVEPSRRARSLKVEVWSLGSLSLEVKRLKVTLFHPRTCTSGSGVLRVRTQSASLNTALGDQRACYPLGLWDRNPWEWEAMVGDGQHPPGEGRKLGPVCVGPGRRRPNVHPPHPLPDL